MRTWGRVAGVWQEVSTDANGYSTSVWLTTLVQALRLAQGESPFFSSVGIPGVQSVIQQILPALAVSQMQALFAPHFASLVITQVPNSSPPTYNVQAVFQPGAVLPAVVAS